MTSSEEIKKKLRTFFKGKPVKKVELFGSVARGEMTERSDVDILITPTPEATLDDLFIMAADVEDLLGRDLDFLLRPSVEKIKDKDTRDLILNSAVTVYDA